MYLDSIKQDWGIKHIKQVDDKTCVPACMAMVAGCPIETVLEKLSDLQDPPIGEMNRMAGLVRLNVLPVRQMDSQLFGEQVYIASVPSLNLSGASHVVVLDTRGGELDVYDPQEGRADRKFYDTDRIEKMGCWINLMRCYRV